jgi:hypothetical protein
MHLYQSSVTSNGPVIGLDGSTLTVRNGPALSLTGGTSMTVTGDFASLINGSKIWVQNGPLIYVDGINAKGTASTLNVTGALVNFGGTGGNQVIVKNDIPITGFSGGPSNNLVPINQDAPGRINIGLNPVKGDPGGGVNVLSVTSKSGITGTGVLIQATNGGRVTIQVPAQ